MSQRPWAMNHVPLAPVLPLPEDLDRLPTQGVAAFVESLVAHAGLVVRRTALDEFADTVTRLAGDEVRTDRTFDQLVALKRTGRITARQMVRLSVAHLREQQTPRTAPSTGTGTG